MRDYIIRRVLLLIPTLFIVTVVVFLLVRFVPGDAIDLIIYEMSTVGGTGDIDRAVVEKALGLDVPVHVQYGRWVSGIFLHGDFGLSLRTGLPIWNDIKAALPVTLELGLMAMIIGACISLPVGLLSAVRQDTWADYVARTFAILLISIPGFWLGTIILIYPAVWWGWSPPMELIKFTDNPLGNLGMFIIPAIVMGTHMSGLTMRVTRTQMLEVMRQDYVRTAWSKGLTEKVVIFRHAAKNALIPVVTVIGGQIPILIGGSVIIETIFVLPGMGRLVITALSQRDYPMISAINLFVAGGVLVVNLIIDVAYSWLDPRVTFK